MKKIVFVNQSSGYLMIDIVNAYAEVYDEVELLAGSVKVTERHLCEKVKLKKIIAYDRSSSFKRLITWSFASLQVFSLLLFKYRHFEIVYVTNPPMAYLSSLVLRNPFSLIVYDTYPDALKNIGVSKSNILYKLWAKWNRKLFAKSIKIVTLSEGMADCLSNYVNRDKIIVVPNWASKESFKPIPKQSNSFVMEHGLENKFTVLYSGNMGYTHNVERIIEVAQQLNMNKDIHFMLIGDGKKKQDMIDKANEYGLSNITFLDWQPVDVLPLSLASADLAIISLNSETARVSVPSKTYNLLAVGVPLLVIAPKESEIGSLVSKYDNGKCFKTDDIDNMVKYIEQLSTNKILRQRLSENSLAASKHFTKDNAKLYVS